MTSLNTNLEMTPRWANWLFRRPGIALAMFWGFAEGTLFFVLPDVPLSFVAMFRPRRAWLHLAAIVAGALLGGALMFSWSERSESARQAVEQVPAVTPAMFAGAEQDLQAYGIWGTSLGPVRGIPYKIYAVEAPRHATLPMFLLVTIPARLWRLVIVWLGFAAAGSILRKTGRVSFAPALHIVFWVVTYAIYWIEVK